MNRSHPVLILVALVPGCASTHQVNSCHPDEWIPDARDQMLGRILDVETAGGEAIR